MKLFASLLKNATPNNKIYKQFIFFIFTKQKKLMLLFVKLIKESWVSALQSMVVNKLRTFLSLLGITIGIFAIVSVFTVVDSLENSIRESIKSLGDNVLFVQKWPWEFGSEYAWWKYMNRPVPDLKELYEIQKRLQGAEASALAVTGSRTLKYLNNSVENAVVLAVTQDFNKAMTLEISEGRYFSYSEMNGGKNVAIIGSSIAENLFPNESPLGKAFKISGRNVNVIAIIKKKGEDNFGSNSDDQVILPISFVKEIINIKSEEANPFIVIKAKQFVSNEELRDELTGILRSLRRLKPNVEDNFAINETSLLTKGFESLFSIITYAGWFIGGFSLLVGGFGIANIMFVSVNERTHIIGIQKSLGAKNYFILLEFLFEAILLSLTGGIIGLLIVFGGSAIASNIMDMNLLLTFNNIVFGITISIVIGIISGLLPAYVASKLNPIDAIRTAQ